MIGVPAGRPAVPGDVHLRVRPQRAGEHPDQADPADVGIGHGLHDLGQQRARGVAGQARHRPAVHGRHGGQGVLGRGRERLGDDLEQFLQPDALRGGGRQDREQGAARDRRFEIVNENLGIDLLVGQVPVHEGLVFALLDDGLDEPRPGLRDPAGVRRGDVLLGPAAAGVVVEAARQEADQAAHALRAVGHGQVQRGDRVAERGPAGLQGRAEVRPLVIDLGDHDRAGRARDGAFLPQHLGQAVHPVRGGDGEQRGVGGPQAGAQVPGKIRVPGGVQEINFHAGVLERDQRQVDRPLLADLDLVEVADGGPVLDPARPLDRPGGRQQGLGQGRLACSGVADQHHVAHALGLAGHWCPAGGSRCVSPVRHPRRLLASFGSCMVSLNLPAMR